MYFQASLVAEREGHWVLARSYAERARAYYEELADRENVGRLLNNLGGLTYLLGEPDEAIEYLQDSLRVLLDEGIDEEAAHVITSLAEIYVDTGRPAEAETAGPQGARDARDARRTSSPRSGRPAHAGPSPTRTRAARRGSRNARRGR